MAWILICFLFICTIIALCNSLKHQNIGSYNFLCICLVLLVVSVFVGPLGYRLGGQYIELEEKVDDIKTQNEGLQDIASSLTKMIYVVIDATGRVGGTPPRHRKKIGEYKKSIAQLLPPQFEEEIASDLSELNP